MNRPRRRVFRGHTTEDAKWSTIVRACSWSPILYETVTIWLLGKLWVSSPGLHTLPREKFISFSRRKHKGRVEFWMRVKLLHMKQPGGKYRSIRQTKISEIQTGIFGRMERAQELLYRFWSLVIARGPGGYSKCSIQIFESQTGSQLFYHLWMTLRRVTIQMKTIEQYFMKYCLVCPTEWF